MRKAVATRAFALALAASLVSLTLEFPPFEVTERVDS